MITNIFIYQNYILYIYVSFHVTFFTIYIYYLFHILILWVKKKKKKKSFTIHIFPPLISSHEHRLISRSIGTLETQRSIRPCLVPSNYKLLLPLSLFCLIPHHQTSVRRKRSRIFFLFFGWEKGVFSFHNVTKRSPNSIEFCSSLFCEIFYSCLFSFPALQAIPKITLLDSE